MHILITADGRSPITRRWINGVLALRHEVTLVSTYPCPELEGLRALHILPVAFSGMAGSQAGGSAPGTARRRQKGLVSSARSRFLSLRYLLGPLTLPFYAGRFRALAKDSQPDLVHALRIPYEGMLASYADPSIPLAVSIWGNDLTLHASGSRLMRFFTTRTLRRIQGLMADSARDIRLAKQWGFPENGSTLVIPGGGGIDLLEIYRMQEERPEEDLDFLPKGKPVVVNPRGFRPGSVRNDIFFQAIPLALERAPEIQFVCAAMAGQQEAEQWVQRLRLEKSVHLLPYLPQWQLWRLFMHADISVSISQHDGTPNSLLEAMACGCFPVAGDIESLREWITPGVNGLLVEPNKPQGLAEAILTAIENPALRSSAAEINLDLIRRRAEMNLVRSQVEVFYRRLVEPTVPPAAFSREAGASINGGIEE